MATSSEHAFEHAKRDGRSTRVIVPAAFVKVNSCLDGRKFLRYSDQETKSRLGAKLHGVGPTNAALEFQAFDMQETRDAMASSAQGISPCHTEREMAYRSCSLPLHLLRLSSVS